MELTIPIRTSHMIKISEWVIPGSSVEIDKGDATQLPEGEAECLRATYFTSHVSKMTSNCNYNSGGGSYSTYIYIIRGIWLWIWISHPATRVSKKKKKNQWFHLNTISLSFKIRITKACKIYQILWEITDVSYENELTFHQDSDFAKRHFHRCKQCSYLFQTIFNTANEGTNNIRIPTVRQESSKEMSVGEKKLSRESHLTFYKELEDACLLEKPNQFCSVWLWEQGSRKVMSARWHSCCNTRSLESSAMPYQFVAEQNRGMKTQSRILPTTWLCHGLHR